MIRIDAFSPPVTFSPLPLDRDDHSWLAPEERQEDALPQEENAAFLQAAPSTPSMSPGGINPQAFAHLDLVLHPQAQAREEQAVAQHNFEPSTAGLTAAQQTRMSSFDIAAREIWQDLPTQLKAFDKAYAQTHSGNEASQAARLSAVREYIVDPMAAKADTLRSSAPDEAKKLDKMHATMASGLLSYDVYFDQSIPELMPKGMHRLDASQMPSGFDPALLQDSRSGYFSALYRDEATGDYVLANRGTEGLNKLDIRANVLQAFGHESQQYTQAMKAARSLKTAVAYAYEELSFTGHSLGGGMASAQTIVTGAPSVTFNSAGLNPATIRRFDVQAYIKNWPRAPEWVEAYYVKGEPLSANQDSPVLQLGTGARGEDIARQMSLNPKLGLSAFDWSDYTLIKPMLSHRFTATEPNILFPAIGARIALTPTPEPVVEAHALHSGTRMPGGPGLHSMSNVMYGLYQNWTPPIQLAHPHP